MDYSPFGFYLEDTRF